MERAKMYFLTCFEKMETNEKGWSDFGAQRTYGFYQNKEDAIESMHVNNGDIRECLYDYGVIEEIQEGIYGEVTWEQLFKFDDEKGGFFEIEKPKEAEHICNFSIG